MTKQSAFAAVTKDGYIYASSTRSMASEVRQHMGKMWCTAEITDWRQGWELAKKDGWRVVKVLLSK